MRWNDFFYFSKGERNALSILLGLIATGWILLMLIHPADEPEKPEEYLPEKNKNGIQEHPADSTALTNIPKKDSKQTQKKVFILKDPKRHFKSNKPSYPQTSKYPQGTVVELNRADTTMLQMIPGIGTAFSNRIVKYRNLLGGFYSVTQLKEVYGIDEEKYKTLEKWFTADPNLIEKLQLNRLPTDTLARHPYINFRQANTLFRLRKQKGKLTGWENIYLLEEFSEKDREKLKHYLSFD